MKNGFTLIELMIVVAIIAILGAIAYPSYVRYVQETRRTDATTALEAAAQQLERYYTERNTYSTAILGTGGVYPNASPNGYYTLSLTSGDATYTLTATPAGAQATDDCGSFSLNEQGTQAVTGTQGATKCWNG